MIQAPLKVVGPSCSGTLRLRDSEPASARGAGLDARAQGRVSPAGLPLLLVQKPLFLILARMAFCSRLRFQGAQLSPTAGR